MQIDLRELNLKTSLIIDETISFDDKYLNNSQIEELKNLHVSGKIYYSLAEELVMELQLFGTMVLIDSHTLDLVDYEFNTEIEEIISNDDLKSYKNDENILDITEILWQNIVLEVPISYSKTEDFALNNGEGWELVNEETKKIDPRLAKLAEFSKLLKEGKEWLYGSSI